VRAIGSAGVTVGRSEFASSQACRAAKADGKRASGSRAIIRSTQRTASHVNRSPFCGFNGKGSP